MGGVDVQPDSVAATDGGDVDQRVEGPSGRGAGAGDNGHDGAVLGAEAGELGVELLGVHAAPVVEADADDLARTEAEDAGGPGHAVVGIGVSEHDRGRGGGAQARLAVV